RGTDAGEDVPGLAWEQYGPSGSQDTSWYSFIDSYSGRDTAGTITDSFNITLWIFPVVSTSATACSVLPVKLISFNAQRNNKDVTLNWQIADEFGMKGYEVERADNNGSFRTAGAVSALNNAKNQSYSLTDKNAFTISPVVQYRLKQIDGDGTVDYSRVINVKSTSSISDISFANPFNGALKMQLNLATAQPVSAYLYDMQGKLVASEKTKMYNAASNTIIMGSTANLQRGVYVLKVIAGTDQAVYKIVKQ
ncbi:MAG TPA: T9SS type A sorting domain-containing protein, partial [Chitinophagaceae bacterium]|nr:T9SS type A sorting domain-containing protein [Chitinophagaceae bacterium]